MKYITDSVFVCIFFNTGFLLMLVNANLEEQGALVAKNFNGLISDFNQDWFTSIGDKIVALVKSSYAVNLSITPAQSTYR